MATTTDGHTDGHTDGRPFNTHSSEAKRYRLFEIADVSDFREALEQQKQNSRGAARRGAAEDFEAQKHLLSQVLIPDRTRPRKFLRIEIEIDIPGMSFSRMTHSSLTPAPHRSQHV